MRGNTPERDRPDSHVGVSDIGGPDKGEGTSWKKTSGFPLWFKWQSFVTRGRGGALVFRSLVGTLSGVMCVVYRRNPGLR